jgi:hypothetical protein
MQRFVAIIALVFAFASLAGATTAHAHRYVSTPIVVLNHVDENNVPIPVFVQVQNGEVDLGSGIVMPCSPQYAVETALPCLPLAPEGDSAYGRLAAPPAGWPEPVPLPPPRAA